MSTWAALALAWSSATCSTHQHKWELVAQLANIDLGAVHVYLVELSRFGLEYRSLNSILIYLDHEVEYISKRIWVRSACFNVICGLASNQTVQVNLQLHLCLWFKKHHENDMKLQMTKLKHIYDYDETINNIMLYF